MSIRHFPHKNTQPDEFWYWHLYRTSFGSGLSDVEAGLRLRYEIRREFAPYIGVNWNKSFGNTASFARDHGKDTDDLQWVIGLRIWF